jgi:hypothetical protein
VRRSKGHPESLIRTGKLAVNLDMRIVTVEDKPAPPDREGYPVIVAVALQKSDIPERAQADPAY